MIIEQRFAHDRKKDKGAAAKAGEPRRRTPLRRSRGRSRKARFAILIE